MANSPLIGKTIEQAGLRHLPELYLVEIIRNQLILPAANPQETLRANDRLVFWFLSVSSILWSICIVSEDYNPQRIGYSN